MKIVITEKQASIEGKGSVTTIFALLTKCIEAVLLAAVQTGELDFCQALAMVLDCTYYAKEEINEMVRGDKNEPDL